MGYEPEHLGAIESSRPGECTYILISCEVFHYRKVVWVDPCTDLGSPQPFNLKARQRDKDMPNLANMKGKYFSEPHWEAMSSETTKIPHLFITTCSRWKVYIGHYALWTYEMPFPSPTLLLGSALLADAICFVMESFTWSLKRVSAPEVLSLNSKLRCFYYEPRLGRCACTVRIRNTRTSNSMMRYINSTQPVQIVKVLQAAVRVSRHNVLKIPVQRLTGYSTLT